MKVLYCKISDSRNKEYQIATRICREGPRLWVEKENLSPEGAAHICGFSKRKEILERLYQGQHAVAPCEIKGSVARFPYIEGQTLENKMLLQIAADRSPAAVARVFGEWLDVIPGREDNRCSFAKTQEFVRWFGDVSGLEGAPSLKACNFDCSSDNLILCGDVLTIIDYEWVFAFPIPTDLIFYRLLKLFYNKHPQIEKILSLPDLLQKCRIHTSTDLLESLMTHFYRVIDLDSKTGISAWKMAHKFGGQVPVQGDARVYCSSIYFDTGDGFSEEQKSVIPFTVQKDVVRWNIPLPQNCKAVRFDPVEGFPCLVKSLQAVSDIGACTIVPLNGRLAENAIFFDSTDPQISIVPPQGAHILEVTAAVYPVEEEIWKQFSVEIAASAHENECLQQKLERTLADNNNFVRQVGLLSEELRLSREESSMLDEQLKLSREESSMLSEQLRLSREEAQIRAAQYSSIANSQFWGMTAPMRKILDAIKRTRIGCLTFKGLHYWRISGLRAVAGATYTYLCNKWAARRPITITEPIPSFTKLTSVFAKGRNFKIYLKDVLKRYDAADGRKVLVLSHELNLTGGPVAVMRMSECLKENGYLPVVVSPHDGPLTNELEKRNIPVLVCPQLYTSEVIRLFAGLFDIVVANTIVSAPAVTALYGFSLPVLWWVHEAETSYNDSILEAMPQFLGKNVHVYTGGRYAKKKLLSHRPAWDVKELLYYVPDIPKEVNKYTLPGQAQGKTVFACIGMLEQRKGQNIFVQALESMPQELVCKGYYIFIGGQFYPPCYQSIMALRKRYPKNVQYIEALPMDTLRGLYHQMDCLVCCSLDDPMPIVVTDAMAASKLIICSEHTGSADILRADGSGIVYHNDDPLELAQCITRVLEHGGAMGSFRSAARGSYETHFSKAVFTRNLLKTMDEIQVTSAKILPIGKGREFSGMVSVVIPVYNAGPAMETLLKQLFNQNGIPQIEVVAVDSGSTDGTPELCRTHGAQVMEIPKSDFSHSYARNLGAKAAHGDVLLFMTQDALPRDENWMRDLTAPILSGEAAAASCREKCPEGTELYYRIAVQNHALFVGVGQSDQLYRLDEKETPESLRRKGSISDVSAAIDAEVFKSFLYRLNYAEDLDMGIRLLRAGYAIKLLSSVQTIHGHNRPVGYYLKRAYVEAKALEDIHALLSAPRQNAEAIARKVTLGDGMLSYAIEKTLINTPGICSTDSFIGLLQQHLSAALRGRLVSAYIPAHDDVVCWCMQTLQQFGNKPRPDEAELFHHVCSYLDYTLHPYLLEQGVTMLDRFTQEEVCDCLAKQFCMVAGRALAGIEPTEPLYETLRILSKGV